MKKSSHTARHAAFCNDCNWDDEAVPNERSIAAVTAAAKRHVVQTGHAVVIESSRISTYVAKR